MRTPRLSEDEVAARLATLPRWVREGDVIRRTVTCATFADAIAFVTRVGFLAEAADHHPDIDIRFRDVTLSLTTHDAGGLTDRDLALAREIDGAADGFAQR